MSKPKLRLTSQQADALYQLFNDLILHDKPTHVFDKLLLLHLFSIYKKLRAKMDNKWHTQSWNLSLQPYEAMAWHEYWQNRSLPPNYVYEASFINQQINELNKLYA